MGLDHVRLVERRRAPLRVTGPAQMSTTLSTSRANAHGRSTELARGSR